MRKALLLLVLLPVAAIAAVKGFIYYKVTSQLDDAIAAASAFVQVSYESVSSTLGGEVLVEGLKVKGYGTDLQVIIDEVGVKFPNLKTLLFIGDDLKKQRVPEQMGFKLNHIRMDLQGLKPYMTMLQSQSDQMMQQFSLLGCGDLEQSDAVSVLQQLGYSEMDGSITMGYRWDRSSKHLVIDSDATWHDMSTSSVSIQLDSIAALTAAGLVSAPELQSVAVMVQDQGYNERLVEYCATSQNISREDFINIHVATLKSALEEQGIRLGEKLFDVYRYYLNVEGPLTFKMYPGSLQKLANMQMYKPSDIPALLGLEIHKGDEVLRDIQFEWDERKFKNAVAGLVDEPKAEIKPEPKPMEQEVSGPQYVEIKPAGLEAQMHRVLKITTVDQRKLEGVLVKANKDRIFIDVPIGGGTATLPITRGDIIQVKVLKSGS